MIRTLHLTIIILINLVVTVYAYDEPPKHFITKKDAEKSGCQAQTLKETKKENCVLNEFDGHASSGGRTKLTT